MLRLPEFPTGLQHDILDKKIPFNSPEGQEYHTYLQYILDHMATWRTNSERFANIKGVASPFYKLNGSFGIVRDQGKIRVCPSMEVPDDTPNIDKYHVIYDFIDPKESEQFGGSARASIDFSIGRNPFLEEPYRKKPLRGVDFRVYSLPRTNRNYDYELQIISKVYENGRTGYLSDTKYAVTYCVDNKGLTIKRGAFFDPDKTDWEMLSQEHVLKLVEFMDTIMHENIFGQYEDTSLQKRSAEKPPKTDIFFRKLPGLFK